MKKRNAFTLAEVLITLGIIGVVAAMTLPTLVQKHQKKVVATRLKQTYSQLYQALNMAQADYGDMKNWDVNDNYGTSIDPDNIQTSQMAEVFAEKYFTPYLKHTGNPRLDKLKNLGYTDYNGKNGVVYVSANNNGYCLELPNGVSLFFSYNGTTTNYSLPIIFVDINGKAKPNIVGRDLFMFTLDSVSNMKILPSGHQYDRTELLQKCSSSASAVSNLDCTALIMKDGWEIKDDYPW